MCSFTEYLDLKKKKTSFLIKYCTLLCVGKAGISAGSCTEHSYGINSWQPPLSLSSYFLCK